MKVMLQKPINEHASTNTGGQYTKPWHAFAGVITGEEVKGDWLNIYFAPTDATGGKFDSFRFYTKSDKFAERIGKLANSIIESNPALKAHEGAREVDSSKWVGLAVGAVYMPQDKNFGTDQNPDWREGPFCSPAYSIPVEQVATFKPNLDKYNAWYAVHWDKSGESAPVVVGAPVTAPPIDDLELPF